MYKDRVQGFSFYQLIKKLNDNFDKNKKEISLKLKRVAGKLFTKENLVVGATAGKSEFEALNVGLKSFVSNLPAHTSEDAAINFRPSRKKKGLIIPGKVQYVTMGGRLLKYGLAYDGNLEVLLNILKKEYLYKNIRAKNGAYGAFFSYGLDGTLKLISYRDPQLDKTLDVYRNIPDYINNFKISQSDLTKFIVGLVANYDFPKSNKQKGASMIQRYFMDYSMSERTRVRTQIIDTIPEMLNKYGPIFRTFLEQNHYAVAGTEDKIRSSKNKFDEIITVIK